MPFPYKDVEVSLQVNCGRTFSNTRQTAYAEGMDLDSWKYTPAPPISHGYCLVFTHVFSLQYGKPGAKPAISHPNWPFVAHPVLPSLRGWNCSLQLVEAIPSWRVFVFGGTADVYGEAVREGPRRDGDRSGLNGIARFRYVLI